MHVVSRMSVEAALRAAVRQVFDDQRQLFTEGAHERSVVFHIAGHLASWVRTQLPSLAVDVEYNRWTRNEKDWLAKRLTLPGGTQVVYPDLIIHRRGRSRPADNVLVVEVKREGADPEAVQHDLDKLHAFSLEPFHYQHAVLLELPRGDRTPRWYWCPAAPSPAGPRTGTPPLAPVWI
ncbi:hypothetical protein [Actinoplanes siamensis]|uniref:hypothetical protein n=1 Tax=Actinoplanes siamensis TaxID=1223317 RepID=UPI001941181F|nr:hypothetical protein [Actinoplanes siamensis]